MGFFADLKDAMAKAAYTSKKTDMRRYDYR